jgi:hypothetical protein
VSVALTVEAVSAAVTEVANERPDYSYLSDHDQCLYVDDTEMGLVPSCLVGHVMARLGVPLTVLLGWNDQDAARLLHRLVEDGEVTFPSIYDEAAVARVLARAQERQDDGVPWGLAAQAGLSYALGEDPDDEG